MSPATSKYNQLLSRKTVGQHQFNTLHDNTWINIAKPRIITMDQLFWDPKIPGGKATAQMKPELLLEITATFGENGHLNKARYPNYGHCR